MHFKFRAIFSLVTFIFSVMHCSDISIIKDINPQTSFANCHELVSSVVSFFASRFIVSEEIVEEKKVMQWGECSLNDVLELRTINKDFNSGIVYSFFPSILCFNTIVDNSTFYFQISRVMKWCESFDISHLPNGFELAKTWISKPYKSFITRAMGFLDIPNKEDIDDLTVLETDSACYLFFQNNKQELLQKAVEGQKNKKKRKYAFLPCNWMNDQGYAHLPHQVERTLHGFTLNGFVKNSIRIPNDIIDWQDNTSYIFLYNDNCIEQRIENNSITQRINFLSLYIVLDMYQRRRWDKDQLIQISCDLFKESLRKIHTDAEKENFTKDIRIRNVIDVHFINDSLTNLEILQEMRAALRACCTSSYVGDAHSKSLVRAVFDEEYEDLGEYDKKLIDLLLQALRLKKSSSKAIDVKDVQYAKDIICYFFENPKVKKGIGFLCNLMESIQDESLIDDENILREILEHAAACITHDHLETFLSYENTLDTRFSQYIIEHLPNELLEQVSLFCCNDKNILSHKYRFDVPFASYSCLLNQCVKKNFMTKEDQLAGVTNFCAINQARNIISINFSNNQNRERIAVARELVRLTSLKNIKDIWEIHQTICNIAPTRSHGSLTNGTDPLFFRAKLYFLWYFKRIIILTPTLAICGALLWKHRLLINKQFHKFWSELVKLTTQGQM